MSQAVKMGARLIESRRKAENTYREMDAVIANDRKVLQMANFENSTTQKIERKQKHVRELTVLHITLNFYNESFSSFSKCSRQRKKNTRTILLEGGRNWLIYTTMKSICGDKRFCRE